MGQTLTKLAKDCDCFEIPWEYPDQTESQKTEQQEQPKLPDQFNVFHDKQIIFQDPIEEESIKNAKHLTQVHFSQSNKFEESEWNEPKSQTPKSKDAESTFQQKQQQMEVIDLDKIRPQIQAEALKRAEAPREKPRKFPLMVKQLYEQEEQPSDSIENQEQTLTNIFQENGQYFIERDGQEFYGRERQRGLE